MSIATSETLQKFLIILLLISQLKSASQEIISKIRNKSNPTSYKKLPDYKPKTCGEIILSPETSDGSGKTRLGEYPWVVGIGYWYPATDKTIIQCAGVLISQRHVLTQGICTVGTDISFPKFARLGEWNTSSTIDCENYICADKTEDILIGRIFTNFDPDDMWSDNIALIKLLWWAYLTRYVAPICLPNVEMHKHIQSYVGSSFVACGWSKMTNESDKYSAIKLKRRVTVEPDEICENFSQTYHLNYDRSKEVCSNSSEACFGDGPVMGIDNSDPDKPYWYIYGFFSYTENCMRAPKIFLKVLPYMEWIQRNMRIDADKVKK